MGPLGRRAIARIRAPFGDCQALRGVPMPHPRDGCLQHGTFGRKWGECPLNPRRPDRKVKAARGSVLNTYVRTCGSEDLGRVVRVGGSDSVRFGPR